MTFQEVINAIAKSIANEEASLTELLKQEAAKIQKFIDGGATPEELLKVNESVKNLIDTTNELEDVLKDKLSLIAPYIQKE